MMPFPAAAPRPTGIEVGLPSPTLYIQNLNEHASPRNVMIPSLRALFSPFGKIERITCRRSLAMKGQAWIEFRTIESAIAALKALQGTRIFHKSMQIRFARTKSFRWARKDGTLEAEMKRRDQVKAERARMPRISRRQMMAQMMANPALGAMMAGPQGSAMPLDVGLPNKTLFLTGIAPDVNEAELTALFRRYPGFDEVRRVPNRPDVAFVEYGSEVQAAAARSATDNLQLRPGAAVRVTFARR